MAGLKSRVVRWLWDLYDVILWEFATGHLPQHRKEK